MTNSQNLLLISMTFISAKYNFVRYESLGLIKVSFIAIKGNYFQSFDKWLLNTGVTFILYVIKLMLCNILCTQILIKDKEYVPDCVYSPVTGSPHAHRV